MASNISSTPALPSGSDILAPFQIINLSNWKLTLPISQRDYFKSGNSSPAEILPSNENPLNIKPLNQGFSDSNYFYAVDVDKDGQVDEGIDYVVFRTPLIGGATTTNSSYVRSELRELYDWQPGESSSSANWNNEGSHRLQATLQVDKYYANDSQTVVGQIHAKDSDKALIKLQWDGVNKPIRAIINENPTTGKPFSLEFDTVGLNKFTYDIQLNENTLSITVNNTTRQLTFGEGRMSKQWDDHEFYFKAGNYAQADSSSSGVFEVNFYKIAVEHSVAEVPEVLFIAGSQTLGSGDQLLVDRLKTKGYDVIVKDDDFARSADTLGKELVLISKSVSSTVVSDKFATVDAPLITWKNELYDDLGLTGVQKDVNFGSKSQTSINILNANHPLAANLKGTVAVYNSAKVIGWGAPGANAINVASVSSGNVNQSALFAYEEGSSLVNGNIAQDKRVGLFLDNTSALTTNALNIFDAAVDWAVA
jgi:hypothetical protein